jgi:hypothetical protein
VPLLGSLLASLVGAPSAPALGKLRRRGGMRTVTVKRLWQMACKPLLSYLGAGFVQSVAIVLTAPHLGGPLLTAGESMLVALALFPVWPVVLMALFLRPAHPEVCPSSSYSSSVLR